MGNKRYLFNIWRQFLVKYTWLHRTVLFEEAMPFSYKIILHAMALLGMVLLVRLLQREPNIFYLYVGHVICLLRDCVSDRNGDRVPYKLVYLMPEIQLQHKDTGL